MGVRSLDGSVCLYVAWNPEEKSSHRRESQKISVRCSVLLHTSLYSPSFPSATISDPILVPVLHITVKGSCPLTLLLLTSPFRVMDPLFSVYFSHDVLWHYSDWVERFFFVLFVHWVERKNESSSQSHTLWWRSEREVVSRNEALLMCERVTCVSTLHYTHSYHICFSHSFTISLLLSFHSLFPFSFQLSLTVCHQCVSP